MDISTIRKKTGNLNRERYRALNMALQIGPMIKGSLYQMSRVCGNPNCKCADGKKHVSWYLSRAEKGKTRLLYVGSTVPLRLRDQVDNYRRYQKLVTRIRSIDVQISGLLNKFRDSRVKEIKSVEEI